MKKIFELQRIIISIQFMQLGFNENIVCQQNVTKFYRIQRLPNLILCWSVSMTTKIKKKNIFKSNSFIVSYLKSPWSKSLKFVTPAYFSGFYKELILKPVLSYPRWLFFSHHGEVTCARGYRFNGQEMETEQWIKEV